MAMQGYERDDYEDLDEYEEEGEEQEEEVEEDEYEDEVAPQPTQEEIEYLELRQRLKDAFRKKIKKESNTAASNSRERANRLPNDNYGSFFGPSRPVIAQRVIQESKSLLENPHLAARVLKPSHSNSKSTAPTHMGSRPQAGGKPPKITNGFKTKVQMLKNTRDYSFLMSDDAELPARSKDPPPRNVSAPISEARSAQPPKNKQVPSNHDRKVLNGCEARRHMHAGSQMQPKVGTQKLTLGSKPKAMSVDFRKQLSSNNVNGPGQPIIPMGLPAKTPPAATEKRVSELMTKSTLPSVRKLPPSKLHSSVPKPHMERKNEFCQSSKPRMMPKQPVSSTKPQARLQPAKAPARATLQDRPKKKPRPFSDEEDDDRAINMIRNMFRYNPSKYRDDDDDSDMEANFDDIMMEEKKSARIARKEDEEELRKIEEEERRERLRKEAKKRKLSRR